MLDEEIFNQEVKAWAEKVRRQIVSTAKAKGVRHTSESKSARALTSSIRFVTKKNEGMISRVGFRFPKTAIYVQKGVGRGTPISKVGQTKRMAKNILSPIEDNIDELVDIAAKSRVNMIINSINIK